MIDLKKLDEKDVIFLNKKTTKEEDLEFSKFLRERKLSKTKINTMKRTKKEKA